ncbi:hypothetical protein BH11MYX2_BH11MYX2_40100 [soil metagenome]
MARLVLVSSLIALIASACGPSSRNGNNGGDCPGMCSSLGYSVCHSDGTFDPPVACGDTEVCDPTRGCEACAPDEDYCGADNSVYHCNAGGTGGTVVEACPTDNVCSGGHCKTPCEAAADNPSNVGCDFLAADLDNEPGAASQAQYSLVVANDNDYVVNILVTKNSARIGDPVAEQQVVSAMAAPHSATRVDLPQREVDGTMGQNAAYSQSLPSGTFVAPHAYHVLTTGPVVLYQFKPIVQKFSNDASTLIPKQALGSDYIVVGYETANPCSIAGLPSIGASVPDHGAITIIPYMDDTHVTVTAGHNIKASAGDSGIAIPRVDKGGTLQLTLGRYMTANLETEMAENVSITGCPAAVNAGQDGDFTGTYIKSDKPVAVFTANERGAGFGGAPNVVYPPDWDDTDDTCCTEHLEEQLFPVTALGKEFAVARSPVRSTNPNWKEPDIIRVVGTVDGTVITTNLPAPFDHFTVDARKDVTFAATTGFSLTATAPVEIAKYLVSQHFVKDGYIGDPSQLLVPAAEQHRKEYVFLVPSTWQDNYGVFAHPVGSDILIDGQVTTSLANCKTAPIGMVAGIDYEQITCLMTEGKHTVSSPQPFGLSVYGYFSVGSYSFVGGSDVKIINPIL